MISPYVNVMLRLQKVHSKEKDADLRILLFRLPLYGIHQTSAEDFWPEALGFGSSPSLTIAAF